MTGLAEMCGHGEDDGGILRPREVLHAMRERW